MDKGAPSPEWLRRRGTRDASQRYKKYLGCPFGLKVMPAFSSFISGEICRMLRSFGITRCVHYIDDLLIVADSAAECQRQMDLAMVLLRLLGLEPAEKKTEGPAIAIVRSLNTYGKSRGLSAWHRVMREADGAGRDQEGRYH